MTFDTEILINLNLDVDFVKVHYAAQTKCNNCFKTKSISFQLIEYFFLLSFDFKCGTGSVAHYV